MKILFLILMVSICFGCVTIHMTVPDETAAVTAADYELTIVGPPKKAEAEGLY